MHLFPWHDLPLLCFKRFVDKQGADTVILTESGILQQKCAPPFLGEESQDPGDFIADYGDKVLLTGDTLRGVDIIPTFINKGDPKVLSISIYHFSP